MRSTLFIILVSLSLGLLGQTAEEEVIRLKQQEIVSGKEVNSGLSESPTEANDASGDLNGRSGFWNLSVGTSYSYSRSFGSGMMYYAAPMFTMPVNDRWAFHGGLIASHYQGFNSPYPSESLIHNSFSGMALFAAASYQMNDRLIFHGTGVKQLLSAPVTSLTPLTPYPLDKLSFGATYKLGNNISIGASIHMNNGRGIYSNPFNRSMGQSPFFW